MRGFYLSRMDTHGFLQTFVSVRAKLSNCEVILQTGIAKMNPSNSDRNASLAELLL